MLRHEMKRFPIYLSAALILILFLGGCGYSEDELTEAREKGYTEGYEKGYSEGYEKGYSEGYEKGYREGTEGVKTRGSVLLFDGSYLDEKLNGHYKFLVTAKVQNLGADGTIDVEASIKQQDLVYEGKNTKITEVYLRQGEEKDLKFYFWVEWPNEGIQYIARCLNW